MGSKGNCPIRMPRRPLLGNDIGERKSCLRNPSSAKSSTTSFRQSNPTLPFSPSPFFPHSTLHRQAHFTTQVSFSIPLVRPNSRRLISLRNSNSSFPFFLRPPHYATLHKTTWRNYTSTDKSPLIPSRNEQMVLLQNITSLTPTLKNMRNSTRNQ